MSFFYINHDYAEKKKKKPNKDNLEYWSTELSLMETMLSIPPSPIKRTLSIKTFP